MAQRPLTDEQMKEALQAYFGANCNVTAAAKALGLDRNTYSNRLNKAQAKFQNGQELRRDIDLRVADGYAVKGYSHQARTETGELIWLKANRDEQEALEALKSAVAAMGADIPRAAPVEPPTGFHEDLLTLYTFTDYHVGMLAWHKENLEGDWDLDIASRMGNEAMSYLTQSTPKAKQAVVNIQGDFLHWDGLEAVTPTSHNVLDADGRFGKVVDVAIILIRSLVAKALAKHEHVTLLICEGNHDIASSLWLRKLFACLYENEPRITVHDSELPYYAIQHGEVMLGFHHGHKRKNEQLPALFAAQFRKMWGEAKRCYIHTGHRHHLEQKDHAGARVIQHPTLAARDAHASRGGWFSDREITAMTYSRKCWVGSVNCTPEMLTA
jgi:hypothetical protein